MATRWGIDHEGRRIEIEPESLWSGEIVHLYVDGEHVAQTKQRGSPITVTTEDGLSVTAKLNWHGGSVLEATLDGEEPRPLHPAPGSREAKREQFKRERPGLYAARHVARAVGKVLAPLLLIGLGINLLPEINLNLDLPAIPFPDLPDLPSIPWPDIDLPALPGWVKAILESAKYWGPILAAVVIAVREYRRRRRPTRPPASAGTPSR